MNLIQLLAIAQPDAVPVEPFAIGPAALPAAGPSFGDMLLELIPPLEIVNAADATVSVTEDVAGQGLLLEEADPKTPPATTPKIISETLPLHLQTPVSASFRAETNFVPASPTKTKPERTPQRTALDEQAITASPLVLIALPTPVLPPQPAAGFAIQEKRSLIVTRNVMPSPNAGTQLFVPVTFDDGSAVLNSEVPGPVRPKHTSAPAYDLKDTLPQPEVLAVSAVNPGAHTENIEPVATSVSPDSHTERTTPNKPHTSGSELVDARRTLPSPVIPVRSIEVEAESVLVRPLPKPEPAATPAAPPVKAEIEIASNLPRPVVGSTTIDVPDPIATESQPKDVVFQILHHDPKSTAPVRPTLSIGWQQNPPPAFDHRVKTVPKYDGHTVAVTSTEIKDLPQIEVAPTASAEPPQPVEVPALPPIPTARRVSIDIGDDDSDSRLRITIHERAGDVSVKFDTATEGLKSDLQSSVGSLIEAFRREHVPLANLDFSNALGNAASNRQREQRQAAKMVRRQGTLPEFALSEVELNRSGNSINIHA
jgi:hypothetical protein